MERPGPVTPHLVVSDAKAALAFYAQAFGAEEITRIPHEDGRLLHAAMRVNGAMVMLMDDFPEYREGTGETVAPPTTTGATSVTIHLDVADCDAAAARAEAAGARVTMAPHDAFWGDRYARVIDPFGHSWSLAHPLAQGR